MSLHDKILANGGHNLRNLLPKKLTSKWKLEDYNNQEFWKAWFRDMKSKDRFFKAPQLVPQPQLLLHLIKVIKANVILHKKEYYLKIDNIKIKIASQIYFLYSLIKNKVINKNNVDKFSCEYKFLGKKSVDLVYIDNCSNKEDIVLIEFWETKNHKSPREEHWRIGELDTINDKNIKILNIFVIRENKFIEDEVKICNNIKNKIDIICKLKDPRQTKINFVNKYIRDPIKSTMFVDSVSNRNEQILNIKDIHSTLNIKTSISTIKKKLNKHISDSKRQLKTKTTSNIINDDTSDEEIDDVEDVIADDIVTENENVIEDDEDIANCFDGKKMLSWHGLCLLLNMLTKEDFSNITKYNQTINFTDNIGRACNKAMDEILFLYENNQKIIKYI